MDQHLQLGSAYARKDETESARREYDAALRLDARSLPALLARGNLAFEGKRWKEAGADYRRALRLDPHHPVANNNLAMVYLVQGVKLEKAARLAETARKGGGPSTPYVLDTLASIYIRQGRLREAAQLLDEAESLASPANKPLLAQLAKTRKSLSKNQ